MENELDLEKSKLQAEIISNIQMHIVLLDVPYLEKSLEDLKEDNSFRGVCIDIKSFSNTADEEKRQKQADSKTAESFNRVVKKCK